MPHESAQIGRGTEKQYSQEIENPHCIAFSSGTVSMMPPMFLKYRFPHSVPIKNVRLNHDRKVTGKEAQFSDNNAIHSIFLHHFLFSFTFYYFFPLRLSHAHSETAAPVVMEFGEDVQDYEILRMQ